jgi:hypothetical protein
MSLSSVHRLFDVLIAKGYVVRHDVRVHDLATGLWRREVTYKVYASRKLRAEENEKSERKMVRSRGNRVSKSDAR